MSEHLDKLLESASRWRHIGVDDYWIHLGYMGADIALVGEHEVTHAEERLWHAKDGGDWVEVTKGSNRWLFSVEGMFVWAKDLITKVLPKADADAELLELRYDDDFGYVKYMRLELGKRDRENLTVEVKGFGLGKHPEL